MKRSCIKNAHNLVEAQQKAISLGVIPFKVKTFPQIRRSLEAGRPVIVEASGELYLIVGHDPDNESFIRSKDGDLSGIKAEELHERFKKGARKALVFSEPWEIDQQSDLRSAFQAGLKITETSPRKARAIFEK